VKRVTEETMLKGQVKDYLNIMGVFNYPVLQGMGAYKGIPDRIMHFKGQVHYLEIKKPKGELSPHQITFQEQCKEDKINYHVIRTIEDLQIIIEEQYNE